MDGQQSFNYKGKSSTEGVCYFLEGVLLFSLNFSLKFICQKTPMCRSLVHVTKEWVMKYGMLWKLARIYEFLSEE